MTKNPLLILCLILLVQRSGGGRQPVPALTGLQLESLMDQVHAMIHAMEKVNSFAHSDLISSLPDMKKMLEVVEKIPL